MKKAAASGRALRSADDKTAFFQSPRHCGSLAVATRCNAAPFKKKKKKKRRSHTRPDEALRTEMQNSERHTTTTLAKAAHKRKEPASRESEGSRSFKTSVIEQAAGRPHCQQDREESRP